MFHKGLNQEQITESAKNLIAECGYDKFSMHRLAEKLGVKPASLYAHVKSMKALLTEVGLLVLQEQKEYQFAAIREKHRDEAVMCLAQAYHSYAKAHTELYRFIMQMPIGEEDALKQAAVAVTEPVMQILAEYSLPDAQKMHWQRILRGVMHGFISQEESGYFSHFPVDVEESYQMAIQCLINGIHVEEAQSNGQG